MIILSASYSSAMTLFRCAAASHEPVIFPTDTIYGIGAPLADIEANKRIYAIKGRSLTQPMPVLVGSFEQMASLAISTAVYPYTAVLPARPKVDRLYTHNGTIAIRLVDGWLGALLEAIGPVTATSVNRSGEAALLEPEAIEARFADECRYMLWGKAGNKASKIVDHTGMTARVIRE